MLYGDRSIYLFLIYPHDQARVSHPRESEHSEYRRYGYGWLVPPDIYDWYAYRQMDGSNIRRGKSPIPF